MAVRALTKGVTYRVIQKKYGMNYRSVQHWAKKSLNHEELVDEKRPGAPKKLSEDNEILVETTLKVPSGTLRRTKRKLSEIEGIDVSKSTIHRVAKKLRLRKVKARKKPLLDEVTKKKRLSWAESAPRSRRYWRNVVFMDEKYFGLTWGVKSAWIGPNDAIPILPQKKFARKIMVWGAVSSRGKFSLVRVPEGVRLKAASYIVLLEENLLPEVENIFTKKVGPIVLEDGAPPHRAKLTSRWYADHDISKIQDFPASSPDLNIIENVWALLGDKVASRPAATLDELWTVIQDEWKNLDLKIIKKIIQSMPARLDAVLKSHGGVTKY